MLRLLLLLLLLYGIDMEARGWCKRSSEEDHRGCLLVVMIVILFLPFSLSSYQHLSLYAHTYNRGLFYIQAKLRNKSLAEKGGGSVLTQETKTERWEDVSRCIYTSFLSIYHLLLLLVMVMIWCRSIVY